MGAFFSGIEDNVLIPEQLLKRVFSNSSRDYSIIMMDLCREFIEKEYKEGLVYYNISLSIQAVIKKHTKPIIEKIAQERCNKEESSVSVYTRGVVAFASSALTGNAIDDSESISTEIKYKFGAEVVAKIKRLYIKSMEIKELITKDLVKTVASNIKALHDSGFIKPESQEEFDLLNLEADILYQQKKFDQAKKNWLKLLSRYDQDVVKVKIKDGTLEIANIYRKVGLTCFYENNYSDSAKDKGALYYYQESEKRYETLNKSDVKVREGLTKVIMNIGLVRFTKQEFEVAASIFRTEVPAYLDAEPDLSQLAHIYANYSQYLYDLGRYNDALKYVKEAMKASMAYFLKKKEPSKGCNTSFVNMIQLLINTANSDEAKRVECLNEARHYCELILKINRYSYKEKNIFTMDAVLAYAQVLKEQGDLVKAKKKCVKVMQFYKDYGGPLQIAEARRLFSEICLKICSTERNRFPRERDSLLEDVRKNLESALKQQEKVFPEKNHLCIAKTYWILAKVNLMSAQDVTNEEGSKRELAKRYILEAFKIYKEIKHPDIVKIVATLAEIYKSDEQTMINECKEVASSIVAEGFLAGLVFADNGTWPRLPAEVGREDLNTYLKDVGKFLKNKAATEKDATKEDEGDEIVSEESILDPEGKKKIVAHALAAKLKKIHKEALTIEIPAGEEVESPRSATPTLTTPVRLLYDALDGAEEEAAAALGDKEPAPKSTTAFFGGIASGMTTAVRGVWLWCKS